MNVTFDKDQLTRMDVLEMICNAYESTAGNDDPDFIFHTIYDAVAEMKGYEIVAAKTCPYFTRVHGMDRCIGAKNMPECYCHGDVKKCSER